MEAPKCKICGTAHWSSQPHAGGAAKAKKIALAVVALASVATPSAMAPKARAAKPKAKAKPKKRAVNKSR